MIKNFTYVLISLFFNTVLVFTVSAQMSKDLVKIEPSFSFDKTEGNIDGEPEMLSFKEKLKMLIDKEAIFLNPQVSKEEIANLLRTSPSVVAEIIKSDFGQDYDTFINSRRVKSAIEILDQPDFQDLDYKNDQEVEHAARTITQQCGFKSTGQFYKQFKKHQGEKFEDYLK